MYATVQVRATRNTVWPKPKLSPGDLFVTRTGIYLVTTTYGAPPEDQFHGKMPPRIRGKLKGYYCTRIAGGGSPRQSAWTTKMWEKNGVYRVLNRKERIVLQNSPSFDVRMDFRALLYRGWEGPRHLKGGLPDPAGDYPDYLIEGSPWWDRHLVSTRQRDYEDELLSEIPF